MSGDSGNGWGGEEHAVMGFYQIPKKNGGRIFVFSDSNCLDDHKRKGKACFWLLEASTEFEIHP